jgi:hypothetical protein
VIGNRWRGVFVQAQRDRRSFRRAAPLEARAVGTAVLLMKGATIGDGVLRGTYFETGFADFMAWRDWGFPDPAVRNAVRQLLPRSRRAGLALRGIARWTPTRGGKITSKPAAATRRAHRSQKIAGAKMFLVKFFKIAQTPPWLPSSPDGVPVKRRARPQLRPLCSKLGEPTTGSSFS